MIRLLSSLILLILFGVQLIALAETSNEFASSKLISIAGKGVLYPNVEWDDILYNSEPLYENNGKSYKEVLISCVSENLNEADVRNYYEKYFKEKGWKTSGPCGSHGRWTETFTKGSSYTVMIEFMAGGVLDTSGETKPVVDGAVIQILFK
jgi:hypothetical protein